jgi:uncharacterized membrane protein YsdA (DUF1294 family)
MIEEILVWYFVIVNLAGFIIMRLDKKLAQNRKRRISEKSLWKTAIIGGACGMTIAMNVYRHKTKHNNFKWGFPFLSLIDLVLIYFIINI